MKYKKFIIKSYRGISDLTEINIAKESLIPIIGKNGSGKTTCLEAINSFDYNNDNEREGQHLNNVLNLYNTTKAPIVVAAEIEVDKKFELTELFQPYLDEALIDIGVKNPGLNMAIDMENAKDFVNINYVKAYQLLTKTINNSEPIIIERDLRSKQYVIPMLDGLIENSFQNSLGEFFVNALPYILYFDDFRDRLPEKVPIIKEKDHSQYSYWITYIDELFKKTKEEYSVFDLFTEQDSLRLSIIGEVQEYLNSMLIAEWANYQFENAENIQIQISYNVIGEIPFLQFKIMEIINDKGKPTKRHFDISDRSKGFFWYFNFMIKLHFNPSKRDVNDNDTIYLLDEPGSYLHSYALDKLVEQLKNLSINNKVIYCTHFHNLLNPKFIPINSIRIAKKINEGRIILNRVEDKVLSSRQRDSAYQPVFDTLEVKSPLIDFGIDNIILLEGLYDYYSFTMFSSGNLAYFPCVSAASILNQIPYMIFLGKKYLAVWDNDEEGRKKRAEAAELFGEIESQKFMLLETIKKSKTRLEDYYDKTEMENFNLNEMPSSNISFNKMVLSLFYSKDRADLITKYFPTTKNNFLEMEKLLIGQFNIQYIDNLYEKNVEVIN